MAVKWLMESLISDSALPAGRSRRRLVELSVRSVLLSERVGHGDLHWRLQLGARSALQRRARKMAAAFFENAGHVTVAITVTLLNKPTVTVDRYMHHPDPSGQANGQ